MVARVRRRTLNEQPLIMKAYEPRGDMGQREELMRLRREHKHMAMDLDILRKVTKSVARRSP